MTQKKMVLGVSGGIAAYKSAELIRQLVHRGFNVQVVMTEAAARFISAMTMQALSGNPVFMDPWDNRINNHMPHIELSKDCSFILIAPATADCIAKLANGMANDLLTSLCLARDCPLVVAPAMNTKMWLHPATQRNIAQLKADNVMVIEPDAGELACGETGAGRMPDPSSIMSSLEQTFSKNTENNNFQENLTGKHILITAGPTVEPIDPVRAITNSSSGKMGYAIADAAFNAGATVTLISGPTHLPVPKGVETIKVQTAAQMYKAVMENIDKADIFFSVAAVSDYHVVNASSQKIKRDKQANITLELASNPDILAEVAKLPNRPFCVGFAAETENWEENGESKRKRKNIPMLVVNNALEAIGSDDNQVTVLEKNQKTVLEKAPKQKIAIDLVNLVAKRFQRKGNGTVKNRS